MIQMGMYHISAHCTRTRIVFRFSKVLYKEKDFANVIQCGQINDVVLESRGEFMPDYYIVLDYTGDHYQLVGYRKKQIFKFQELPYDLKIKITFML